MSGETLDAPTPPAGEGGAPDGCALWQLPADCHGLIVGCCWTAAELRRLTDKLFGGQSSLTDFELHVAVVQQCASRNKVSLALQRELRRRCAAQRPRFDAAVDAGTLQRLWTQALNDGEAAAALWPTLTHAHCDEALQVRVMQDIYLLQHERVALQPHEAAVRDAQRAQIAALKAAALRAEQRQARWRHEALAERQALQAQLAALRGRVLAQDAQITRLLEKSPTEAPAPARTEADAKGPVPQPPAPTPMSSAARTWPDGVASAITDTPCVALRWAPPPQPAALAAGALLATRVLCVGGRHGHVPQYRELVERHGGRFVHHDGGIDDNVRRLDAQLAAADVVLCQSGCLNHNAYARVKAHCKRSGKPCVFLDKPGIGSFLRGLAQLPARSG